MSNESPRAPDDTKSVKSARIAEDAKSVRSARIAGDAKSVRSARIAGDTKSVKSARTPKSPKQLKAEVMMTVSDARLPLTQGMHQVLLKCSFSLPDDSRRYSLYSPHVLGALALQLTLPLPVTPHVMGHTIEGSLCSLLELPVPTDLVWMAGDTRLPTSAPSITLTQEHIGHVIKAILYPFCPREASVRFPALMTSLDEVQPLPPVVFGIRFPEHVVEGIQIVFDRLLLPDREGDSEIRIERTRSPSGGWEPGDEITPSLLVYTPTHQDIGCFLRIKYLPVLNDGVAANEATYFYSQGRVAPGIPAFRNPKIAGELCVGHPVVAIAEYAGGRKGRCAYAWFASRQPLIRAPFEGQVGAERQSARTPILELGPDLAHRYLGVEMVPVREDDTIGETAYAITERLIGDGDDLEPIRGLPQVV
jgi:hypothetical protein